MKRSAIVVGAGVGGLATAAGLHAAGWDVTVLERWPEVVGAGAGIAVWPDAQRVLERLGAGPAIKSHAVEFGGGGIYTSRGSRLSAFPEARIARREGMPMRILPRQDLVSGLLEAAEGVTIRTGVVVTDVAGLLAQADVVVGADGVGSTVRKLAFDDRSAPRDTGRVAWRGRVPMEAGGYGETWGSGALFGVTRLAPGWTNWYAVPPPALGVSTLEDLRRAFSRWRDPVPAVLDAATEELTDRHPLIDLHPELRSFVAGRVALVGDSAHAMMPSLGRGACEALLDAEALVAELTAADGAGRSVESALLRYDARRRIPAQRTAVRSSRATAVATLTTLAPLRNAVVRVAGLFLR